MDHLGLVEAVDRLGQGVVVAVADAADRGLDAGLGQALGVADRDVLDAAVAVMDEAAAAGRAGGRAAPAPGHRARSRHAPSGDTRQPTIRRA